MSAKPRWYAFALLGAGLLASRVAHAQVVTLLENDTVRVYQATIKAGTSTAQHTHSLPHVTYVQSGGTLQIRRPSGPPDTLRLVTGSAYWGKVETHITDNIGPTDVVLVTTDLKPPRARRTP